ncbi:MAG: hypothetical protein JNJ48_08785 [Phycisphaerae bacterium]|nr:hypothetical protein [Phycisphaerae bacterium]
MLFTLSVRSSVVAASALVAFAAQAGAETIILRSGQVSGVPGLPTQVDDSMTFGPFAPTGPLSANPFTAADFNATTANQAVVVNPYTSWLATLPFDSQARWVGTGNVTLPFSGNDLGQVSTVLYRVPFTVTTVGITSASISIAWACDDTLGDLLYGGANPVGAYLRDPFGNVTALTPVAGGGFSFQSLVLNYNITGAIGTGLNELFLYQRDQGSGISGLIFSAEITVLPSPAAASLLGIAGLAATRRRRA